MSNLVGKKFHLDKSGDTLTDFDHFWKFSMGFYVLTYTLYNNLSSVFCFYKYK